MKEHATTSGLMDRRRQFRFRRVCKWLIMSVALIVAAGAVFQFSMGNPVRTSTTRITIFLKFMAVLEQTAGWL